MKYLKQGLTSLTSINISPDYAAWSSGTTYSALDYVLYGTRHYMSVVNSNLNVIPSQNTGKWLLWEVANQYALLDLQANTSTICNASTITTGTDYDLTIEADVTGLDTMIIGNAVGSQVTVVEKNSVGTTIATTVKTIDETQESPSVSFPLSFQATTTDIVVTVTELTTGGYSSLGSLIIGNIVEFGGSLYKPGFELNGEIIETRDPSEIVDIDIKNGQNIATVDIVFDSSDFPTMKRNAISMRGITCGWIIDDDIATTQLEGLTMVGYLDQFIPVLSNPTKSYASIEIREVS